jgi:hypothetical protein
VGIVAAVVAVNAYKTQQQETRRQEKAKFYAEAVRVVEDYMEAPYRILRKDGSAEARRAITQHISDVKSRISFYTGWMAIHGTIEIRAAYDAFVNAAQREAGPQMTAAWNARPVNKDKDVPLRTAPPPTPHAPSCSGSSRPTSTGSAARRVYRRAPARRSRRTCVCLQVHHPRARHSSRWGRSAPRVLSFPWPG